MDNSRSCDSFHLLLLLPNLTMRWKPDEKPWTWTSPKVQKLREAAPKFLSESKGIFTQLTSRPVHDDEDYLRKGKDLTMGILRCGRKAQAGNGRRFEDSFNYILRRPNSRRWMTAEWAEWLTVAWSKIPLARDSFLLLMTRTMNESMVGKSW